MKVINGLVSVCIALVGASLSMISSIVQADAEVTGNNSQLYSSWTAKVDGRSVYSGSRFFDAVNAAINAMGAGTIHIRNSGSSGAGGSDVYAIKPRSGQTLDFHDNTVHANGGELIVPVYCDRKENITIRNLKVTGNPRYGVWFRGCSDVVFENITMDLDKNNPVGLGIRVDGSTGPARDLTITGDIVINGSKGHGIETYSVDGFNIGDVTVTNSGGCGLLLNDSRNGIVGNVSGHHNNLGGGYATFRVANNNGPNVTVNSVYSRDSGRGFFRVSGSHGTTINYVDIANTTSQGILLQTAQDTHVLSGMVRNGNPNCRLDRATQSSINVDGCEVVGTPPSDGFNPFDGMDEESDSVIEVENTVPESSQDSLVDGTYRIEPVHSNKTLDVAWCETANGSQVQQWEWLNNDCQKWLISETDGEFYRLSPLHAQDKALQVIAFGRSANSANVWRYRGRNAQQFRFQSQGDGRWQIINRGSQQCLTVQDRSLDDGADLIQARCQAGSLNQQFELIRQ